MSKYYITEETSYLSDVMSYRLRIKGICLDGIKLPVGEYTLSELINILEQLLNEKYQNYKAYDRRGYGIIHVFYRNKYDSLMITTSSDPDDAYMHLVKHPERVWALK